MFAFSIRLSLSSVCLISISIEHTGYYSLYHRSKGVHPPQRKLCIFPLFQISPLFPNIFQRRWKILQIIPFQERNLCFYLPKFLMIFYSH